MISKIKVYRFWLLWDKLQAKLDNQNQNDLATLCFFQKCRIQNCMYYHYFENLN